MSTPVDAKTIIDAVVAMHCGDSIFVDDSLHRELKRRRLIRKPVDDDCLEEWCDFVISGNGHRMAERYIKEMNREGEK